MGCASSAPRDSATVATGAVWAAVAEKDVGRMAEAVRVWEGQDWGEGSALLLPPEEGPDEMGEAGFPLEQRLYAAFDASVAETFSLFLSPYQERVARLLHEALCGARVDQALLLTALLTTPPEDLPGVLTRYSALFGQDLLPLIAGSQEGPSAAERLVCGWLFEEKREAAEVVAEAAGAEGGIGVSGPALPAGSGASGASGSTGQASASVPASLGTPLTATTQATSTNAPSRTGARAAAALARQLLEDYRARDADSVLRTLTGSAPSILEAAIAEFEAQNASTMLTFPAVVSALFSGVELYGIELLLRFQVSGCAEHAARVEAARWAEGERAESGTQGAGAQRDAPAARTLLSAPAFAYALHYALEVSCEPSDRLELQLRALTVLGSTRCPGVSAAYEAEYGVALSAALRRVCSRLSPGYVDLLCLLWERGPASRVGAARA